MAPRIAQEGGTSETSRFLWLQMRDSTSDPSIRNNAEEHLIALKAEQDAEHLKPLVAAGLLRGVTADPAGFPYGVDQDGKITLPPKSRVSSPLFQAGCAGTAGTSGTRIASVGTESRRPLRVARLVLSP